MLRENIRIPNFLNQEELLALSNIHTTGHKFYNDNGLHDNELTSIQQWITSQDPIYNIIHTRLKDCFKNYQIDGIQLLTALKPYDVHSDFIVQKDQVPLIEPGARSPTYTIIIPLEKGFNTIVFDQNAEFNNFVDYKESNDKVAKCIDEYTWRKFCAHCHSEDREYLTVHEIFDWSPGTLFGFDRRRFHCSGNFQKSKKGLVAWLSE